MILTAVALVSITGTILLNSIELVYAIISLAVGFILGAFAILSGFTSRNLNNKGTTTFTIISIVLLIIGVVLMASSYVHEKLRILSGAFLGLGLSVILFMLTKMLRLTRDKSFASILFISYVLWLVQMGIWFSISDCFIGNVTIFNQPFLL
ncbi:unnamed protein product [Trichobilharzia szidati]|nr:unnamed protein product [Trichobilharzia szidati]